MKNSSSLPLQGVLFDWDGTLLNSYAADTAAYLAMFREMQIPWGVAELEQHYSPNWYNVYRAAKLPHAKWDAADKAWRLSYSRHRPKLLHSRLDRLRLSRGDYSGLANTLQKRMSAGIACGIAECALDCELVQPCRPVVDIRLGRRRSEG